MLLGEYSKCEGNVAVDECLLTSGVSSLISKIFVLFGEGDGSGDI